MKAAVNRAYGTPDVVRVEDVVAPAPGPKDVLIRVHATAVTAADARIRGARFPRGFTPVARLVFGIRRPRRVVLGGVFSGVVEAIGTKANGFAVGDEVCGMTGLSFGCHAEFVTVAAKRLARKPAEVTHEQAAGLLFGGSTALHFLHTLAQMRRGQSVLINGASGAIGTNAVQLAKHAGAEVTAVTSAANAALVADLGADHVIDYATTALSALDARYDVVLDAVGNLDLRTGRRLLSDSGVLLLAVAPLIDTVRAQGNVKAGPAPERPEGYTTLLELVAKGELTVVNSHVLGLDEIVRAHEIVDSGHKVGNIVLRLV